AFTGPAARTAGQARISLAKMSPNASTLVQQLPAAAQAQEGVLFERLRWRRRRGMDTGALEILQQKPEAPAQADIWWGEMNILMRRAIEKRDYAGAYKIAAQHKMTTGSEYAQAE